MAGDDGENETATETSGGDISETLEAPTPTFAARTNPALGVVGRFRLEVRLGSGGMGDVYRAYDPALDRAVALKVLRSRDEARDGAALPQQMRRVLREARAAAALTHPNTVTIFDVGEADGTVFIAMELLDGATLRAVSRKKPAPGDPGPDFAQKMQWLKQAALALAAAHERGLVHRDVKPDNMFICAPSGTLKLLDFGIAKREDNDDDPDAVTTPDSIGPSSLRTEMGVRVGTPRYMAPEQRAGLGTDARTDQFAWGLIAFELLTGTHPLAAPATVTNPTPGAGGGAPALTPENLRAALAKAPQVSKTLASVIVRALSPLQHDRFASMEDLLAALDERETRTSWRWIGVAAAGVAGVAGLALVVRARPAPPIEVAPRCHVESLRTIPVDEDDRVGGLTNGDLAIARHTRQGLTVQRELAGDAGVAPAVSKNPIALQFMGIFAEKADYDDIELKGLHLAGESWLLTIVDQGFPRGPFILGVSEKRYLADRITPPVSGLDMTGFGEDRLLIGVTTPNAGERLGGLPNGAEIYITRLDAGPHPINVEVGEAYSPSVASSADGSRIAFAYALQVPNAEPRQQQLRLAMLDATGERLSDVKTLHTQPRIRPAVAFADATRAALFWIEDLGSITRLRSATYAPGDPAPTPPKVAAEESALSYAPVTARLPTGAWAAAWVGVPKSVATLRVAPVTANGDLVGPTSVAPLPASAEALTASANDRGVTLSWREMGPGGARVAKIAEVTCH